MGRMQLHFKTTRAESLDSDAKMRPVLWGIVCRTRSACVAGTSDNAAALRCQLKSCHG